MDPESIKSGGVTAKRKQTLFANSFNFIDIVLFFFFFNIIDQEFIVLYDQVAFDWMEIFLPHFIISLSSTKINKIQL